MDRCQVGVRVGEGWVDLDGAGVALESALHVVHLLQGVAHVGVCVGEGRLDPAQEGSKPSFPERDMNEWVWNILKGQSTALFPPILEIPLRRGNEMWRRTFGMYSTRASLE